VGERADVVWNYRGRRQLLHPRRIGFTIISSTGLVLGCLFFLSSGCGGDSKTTGTQVQISPEVKAELDDMRSAQKEVRAERKAEKAAARQKRK
jgi:hypothetical protein